MSLLNSVKQSAAVLGCDAGLLYEVLTDYDNYVEWLPQVAQSKLLAREGDLAIAEFELAPPHKEKFTIECIHTRNKMVLWRTIGGKIPISQVEWSIESAGDQQTKVTLAVLSEFQWARLLPWYRTFLRPALTLKALQAQISTYFPEIALPEEEGEKILEIAEMDEGVVCWIRGKKYILKEPEGTND